jgi:hypothetical protein
MFLLNEAPHELLGAIHNKERKGNHFSKNIILESFPSFVVFLQQKKDDSCLA